MLITVIVPIYNAEQYLKQCLDSIVSQEYRNLEIILINDGSTDDSLSICKEYAEQDSRINVISQENGGLVHARKVGIAAATGDYISFVDADDYIEPDMYSKLAEILKEPLRANENDFLDILCFGFTEEYSDHSVIKKDHFEAGIYDKKRLQSEVFPRMLSYGLFFDFGMFPNLWCKLFRKAFLDRCYYNVSDIVRIGEDADMFFQLLPQASFVRIVDFCPYHYRKYDLSMMQMGIDYAEIEALYRDLKCSFNKFGMKDVVEQLEDYITFIKLLKAPDKVPGVPEIFSGDIRIALYGAGGFGKALYDVYGDNICLWVDKAYERYSERGFPVSGINELTRRHKEYDVIFIAILKVETCKQIQMELQNMGISKEIFYFGMP